VLKLAAGVRVCQQKCPATSQVLAHLQLIRKNDATDKQKSLAFAR
jgi:hypothetical protein